MKYIFSFLILTSSLNAHEVISIHFPDAREDDAKFVASALENQLGLPKSLIRLSPHSCEPQEYDVATICISDSGGIEVKQVKSLVMGRMLRAFGGIDEAE